MFLFAQAPLHLGRANPTASSPDGGRECKCAAVRVPSVGYGARQGVEIGIRVRQHDVARLGQRQGVPRPGRLAALRHAGVGRLGRRLEPALDHRDRAAPREREPGRPRSARRRGLGVQAHRRASACR
eukprot:3362970-Prymnesium_polylepis.1